MSAKTIRDYKLVDAVRLINERLRVNGNSLYYMTVRSALAARHTAEIFDDVCFTDASTFVMFMRLGMGNYAGGAYRDREDYLRLCAYVHIALAKQDDTPAGAVGVVQAASLLTDCVAGEGFLTGNNFDGGEVHQEVIANDNGFYLIGKSCEGVIPDDAKPFMTLTEFNRIPELVQLWVDHDELIKEVGTNVEAVTKLLMCAEDSCEIPPVIGCYRQLCKLDWHYVYPLNNVLQSIVAPKADRDSIECYANSLIELVYTENQPRGMTTLQGDILKALQASLKETLYGNPNTKPFKKVDDILSLLMPNGKDAELTLEEDIIMAGVYETLVKHPNIIKRLAKYKEIEEGKQPPV